MTSTPASSDRPFRTACVLGSGVMGSQIAAHLANAGLTVQLLDLPTEGHDRNAVAAKSLAAARKLSPNPFFTADVAARIQVGNFEDDWAKVGEVDWIIEAVIERMDIKQDVMRRVEEVARPDAVIATNTSGLPIAQIAAGRGEPFRRRFLGCHFFNPPRYLQLFEIIPTADTDPDIVARVSRFARLHLGKGVVVAKDTPNFIGNRIGIYAAMGAIRQVTENDYSIEEVDELTGTLIGHAKSATFRTADLVGLDVLVHVANNLFAAVEDDESRETFRPPWLLLKLVERGSLGAKTKAGFYTKQDGKILSIDPESMKYAPPRGKKLGDLDAIRKAGSLPERLRKLYDDKDRAGEFFRATTLDLLAYSARRVPEIADEVVDVDRALRLGFGWRMGPFELWDELGFTRVLHDMRARRLKLPDWIDAMEQRGASGFYERRPGVLASWSPAAAGPVRRDLPEDEIDVAALGADGSRLVWGNEESALLDMGAGVLLFEFRSKMNSIGRKVLEGLQHAITTVEDGPWAGLVIGNDKDHFSVGANLGEVGMAVMQGHWSELEQGVAGFQQATQRIHYAGKPVIVATRGRVLGGACEMTMASSHPVCAAESYIGLVEIGAGLIPAGGGTMRMAALCAARAASDRPDHIAPHLRVAFETLAMGKVATSAHEAVQLGFMSPAGAIVMNADRRLWVARQMVVRLAEAGYRPPPVMTRIRVLGRPGRGPFEVGIDHLVQGGFVAAYDAFVAKKIAWVITGGDLPSAGWLHEEQLLDLEREVFLTLLGEKKTQQKIADLLTRNQPKAAQMAAKGLVSLTNVFRKKRPPAKKPS